MVRLGDDEGAVDFGLGDGRLGFGRGQRGEDLLLGALALRQPRRDRGELWATFIRAHHERMPVEAPA